MSAYRGWYPAAVLLVLVASPASGQESAVTSAQAAGFMGIWVFTMTEPDAFKGSEQTIRIWDENGVIAASVQTERFPAVGVTGIIKDGDMLVLTISHEAQPKVLENGAPIWVVISLTPDGDTMTTAQMLERSRTIKRGTGQKQGN